MTGVKSRLYSMSLQWRHLTWRSPLHSLTEHLINFVHWQVSIFPSFLPLERMHVTFVREPAATGWKPGDMN